MKLATIDDYRVAIINGEQAIDVTDTIPALHHQPGPRRMTWLIEHYDEVRPALQAREKESGAPLAQVRLRAPVPDPGKILAVVGNYREGLEFSQPIDFFVKSSHTVIGCGDTIRLPDRELRCVDHEAELMAVVGKRLSGPVSREDAETAIFGYTGFIDVSGRGFGETGFVRKSCDTFGPMGPWIVTADEVGDPQALDVRLTVAGEPRQAFNTSDMDHDVVSLVVWLAEIMTLEPGDVVSTGTNHQGIGRVQQGDEVTLSISRIGDLRVGVSDPRGRSWPRGVDESIGALAKRWRTGDRSRS